ncbi:hypothetical protein D3C81_2328390 [compost metagenome]
MAPQPMSFQTSDMMITGLPQEGSVRNEMGLKPFSFNSILIRPSPGDNRDTIKPYTMTQDRKWGR